MKKIISVIPLLIIAIVSYSQQNTEPCYFDEYQRKNESSIQTMEKKIAHYLKNKTSQEAKTGNIYIIPVVVHIIHNGGSENISDAQIQSQIDVLNEDFRKISGSNGDGNGVDTEIEFCLAKITPDGKCTNGIVRIQSPLANHQTYQRSQLKNLSYWDNIRYLNMYIVKNINNGSGILGYSSFPGGPPDEDGIVVRHDFFGKIGTASGSLGRTTTHEIGHWFGLYHTFNGGCGVDVCTDGDYVCDTPPAANPNFGCPVKNSCSNDSPDVNDQVANYLDYSDDYCKSMFTQGQKDRMQATLNTIRNVISSASNISATGCDSNFMSNNCNVVADFTANSQDVCTGNSIGFINKTLNNPDSFQWFFPGGIPNSSVNLNPIITYTTPGTYLVKLIAYGMYGKDSVETLNYITVSNPPVGQPLSFYRNFEDISTSSFDVTIDNPDGGITWEIDTIAVPYEGKASIKINNLINTNYGQSDAIVLPNLNLTTIDSIKKMSFRWAYARSDASYSDELIVLISTDCGVNFTQIYYKTGSALATGPTQITPYIPDSNTVWKLANINLAPYDSATNAIIKIVNVTDGGNNLYIDHINIGGLYPAGIAENTVYQNMSVYPNPIQADEILRLNIHFLKGTHIEIMNMMGTMVYSSIITKENDLLLSGNILKTRGMYIIKLYNTHQTFTSKILKQ